MRVADIARMAATLTDRHVRVEHLMGTVVSVDVRGARHGVRVERALDDAMAWLRGVEARFSPYRDDSEVSRLDRHELALIDASPDVRWILDRCAQLRQETGGFFDVRATGRLDPSALVKGWAAQRAADLLRLDGLTDFCLSAGGDVVVAGDALPERGWRVGIQHPLDREAVAATIAVSDRAVATSGAYERGDHVRDPLGAGPPQGVLSVTVVGADLGTADAYSTAAFAMGLDGPAWTATLHGHEAMTILADGTVLSTAGFPLQEEA